MIIDFPNEDDFENVGFECLLQAYQAIFKVDNYESSENVQYDSLWKYHEIILKTAIVLIHQGIESLMKAKICAVSPLLLIDQKRSEWKTLPSSLDESFSELVTIGGNDLLRTCLAVVGSHTAADTFVKHYENIRVLRNKIVHGTSGAHLTASEILKLILITFTLVSGKDSFWTALTNKFYDHPEFETDFDKLDEQAPEQSTHLNYLETFLGIKELNKHFKLDLEGRRYFCPRCTLDVGMEAGNEPGEHLGQWAFLNPRIPSSTNLECVVCSSSFMVTRKDCKKNGCKGNVIFYEDDENVCLTCLVPQ